MRSRVLPFVCALMCVSPVCVSNAFGITVALGVSANPVTYGRAVTLTATVTPAASGTVAFYDGVTVVGVAPLAAGTATLTTQQLRSGSRKLLARYAGIDSAPVTVSVTPLAGTGFSPVTTYPVGPASVNGAPVAEKSPGSLAVADFNRDGKLDAVLPVYSAQTGTDSLIAVMIGNGNGSFQFPIYITAGTNITSVAVGDFNGDGIPDVALADLGNPDASPAVSASINISLGNGDGTFRAPTIYPIPGQPYYLIVGDFNLDGKEDVAVSNQAGATDVYVLLGNGNGTLGAPVGFATGTQTGAFGLALGDFNGDGLPDIAVAEEGIVILLGNGGGSFTVGSVNVAGDDPNDVEMGDFNGDGIADLVNANGPDNTISVFIGNGNGTFQPQMVYNVDNTPISITVADINGDGKQDIAVANSYLFSGDTPPLGTISILNGIGNGTFQAAVNYPTGPTPVTVVQGDFTGEGTVDLATADLGDGSDTYPGDLGVLVSSGCVSLSTQSPTNYDTNGGTLILNVNASNGCSWTAVPSAPWITLTSASGTGYGQIAVSVLPNTTGADRSGNVNVGGQIVNIIEDFTQTVFTDVPPGATYFDAVNLLATHDVTNGCAPSQFCPLTNITRAQMAVFIVRSIFGGDNFPPAQSTPYFADVTPTTFGFPWIQKLYELGITSGCAPDLFCPTANISRDQMAVFIIRERYGPTTNFTFPLTPYFSDVPATAFAFNWIQRMAEDTITTGCAPSLYCPSSPVTRGDMAVFIIRGAYNELLPPTEPVISSIVPATLAAGTSGTFTVTGVNTNFIQGTTVVVPVLGMTASPVTAISPTQFTVTLTAPATAVQPISIYVQTGTEEAVLPNGLTIQ